MEPAGRHKRGTTGRDQILIDTEHTLCHTGAVRLTQPCPLHTLVPIGRDASLCVCVFARVSDFPSLASVGGVLLSPM